MFHRFNVPAVHAVVAGLLLGLAMVLQPARAEAATFTAQARVCPGGFIRPITVACPGTISIGPGGFR